MSHQVNLRAGKFADMAVDSLIEEANLTPKPGLVDRANNGAHSDLNIELMIKSANSLKDTFKEISKRATNSKIDFQLRTELAEIGVGGETKMLETTKGINTHKGAIWILGLLVAGVSMSKTLEVDAVLSKASQISRIRLETSEETHGYMIKKKYGFGGAREEAETGFINVKLGYLAYMEAKKLKYNHEQSLLYALLRIMSKLNDTCILHRGGMYGLKWTQKKSEQLSKLDFRGELFEKKIEDFDKDLIRMNLSPGGVADLIGAVIFLLKV